MTATTWKTARMVRGAARVDEAGSTWVRHSGFERGFAVVVGRVGVKPVGVVDEQRCLRVSIRCRSEYRMIRWVRHPIRQIDVVSSAKHVGVRSILSTGSPFKAVMQSLAG